MTITPLTIENIDEVFADLSETSMRDAEDYGKGKMRKAFIDSIGLPFSGAFYNDAGQVCALVRMSPIDTGYGFRFFFVDRADGMKTIGIPFTMFIRNMSNDLIDKHDAYLEVLTRGDKASRWFQSMGFNYFTDDGHVFKYVKHRKE